MLGWESFGYRDFLSFGHPLAFYHRESLGHGRLPFWNPFNNCGLPFLAQWNTLVLYPPALLYCVFPFPWSLNIFCLLHLYFGGLGMAFLVRRWTGSDAAAAVAGSAFAFNGLTLNSLVWPHVVAALGWAPWLIASCESALERGSWALLRAAAIGAIQMVTGSPEVILPTWLVAVTAAFAKRRASKRLQRPLRLLLLVALVAGLASPQLLPFFALLRFSQRDIEFGSSEWSMPLWGFANFLVPLFRFYRTDLGVYLQYEQKWTSSYYPGVGVVALTLFALFAARDKRVLSLAMLTALCLWLALGEAGKLFSLFRRAVPFLGLSRFPVKFVIPSVLIFPLLAGAGLAAWLRAADSDFGHTSRSVSKAPRRKMSEPRIVLIVVGALLVLVAMIVGFSYAQPYREERSQEVMANGAARGLFLLLTAGTLFWRARNPAAFRHFLPSALLPLLVALDGLTHVPWQNPAVPPDVLAPGLVQLEPQPRHGNGRAWLTPSAFQLLMQNIGSDHATNYLYHRMGLFPNGNLLDQIPIVDGFFPLELRAEGIVSYLLRQTTGGGAVGGLLDFLGVNQVLTATNGFQWHPRSTGLPLLTAGQAPLFASDAAIYQGLIDPSFDPGNRVFLPSEARSMIRATGGGRTRIVASRVSASRVEAEVEASEFSLLVLAQSFYPAWKGFIDGRRAPIFRANSAFQALEIPPGRHRMELVYHDRAFELGLLIATMTIGAGFIYARRSHQSPDKRRQFT